ncbi:MAG: hypothetical protein JSS22_10260 [Proteobacteria bacterium]|nr:hypothetical protein [Pseudomonadota bacterium]
MAGFFDTLFGGGAEKEAANANRALYNTYQQQGTGYLDNALGQSSGVLNSALGAYAPVSNLASMYGGGSKLYLDALGVNGGDAQKAAQSSYTSSPGYQFSLDQGLQALQRTHAAAGNLNSGNADADTLKYAQGLASQDYNNWLTNLSGVNNNALTAANAAAGGQAGVYGSLANLYQNDASNRVNLLGNSTSGQVSANNLQAQGEAAGAKNLLGLGLGVAGLATGGVTGLGGLGLGSLFMGGGSPTGYGTGGLFSGFK